LVMTVDCNSRYVQADPKKGASIAVAEAARNISCTGGTPVGVTNCLNFGNPYNPEVYWQFVMAIQGMGEACKAFDTPVTGGNVSFYNHTVISGQPAVPVFPTPTIGMLGLMEHYEKRAKLAFQNAGDAIFLIGNPSDDFNASEYLHAWHKITQSPAPAFDMNEELAVQQTIRELIAEGLVASVHDVSDGGLFCAVAESAFPHNLGFQIQTDAQFRRDGYLFGEAQGRIVVSVAASNLEAFNEFMALSEVPYSMLGEVLADAQIWVDDTCWGDVEAYRNAWERTLPEAMGHGTEH